MASTVTMRQPGKVSPSAGTVGAVARAAGVSSFRDVTTPGCLSCGPSWPPAPGCCREPVVVGSAAARAARLATHLGQRQQTAIGVGGPAALDAGGEADPRLTVGP